MKLFRGPKFGAGGGGGGGAVLSVFGRIGAVIATVGDYLASEVSNDSGVTGATVKAALDNIESGNSTPFRFGGSTDGNSLANRFCLAEGSTVAPNANEPFGARQVQVAGTLRNLRCLFGVNLAGQNITLVVRVNGVDTAITATVVAGTASANDLIHTVAVNAGDKVSLVSRASVIINANIFHTHTLDFVPSI